MHTPLVSSKQHFRKKIGIRTNLLAVLMDLKNKYLSHKNNSHDLIVLPGLRDFKRNMNLAGVSININVNQYSLIQSVCNIKKAPGLPEAFLINNILKNLLNRLIITP